MGTSNKVQCLECKQYFSSISWHIKTHDLTVREYGLRHPGAPLYSKDYIEKQRESYEKRSQNETNLLKAVSNRRPFNFVKNKELRILLERDIGYARKCLKNQLWKPSIVLYGSIIEAILVEKTNKKQFSEALDSALGQGFITEKEFHKIHIVKNLRNFVHVHKELSEKEEINDYWAKTFADICESLIRSFKED